MTLDAGERRHSVRLSPGVSWMHESGDVTQPRGSRAALSGAHGLALEGERRVPELGEALRQAQELRAPPRVRDARRLVSIAGRHAVMLELAHEIVAPRQRLVGRAELARRGRRGSV